VKNLTDILNDFLSLEKLEAGKIDVHMAPVDLKIFIDEMQEELQTVAKPGQKILHLHEGANEANLDKQLLRNVMINLINNAIKYSEENKTIEVKSKIDDGEAFISVRDEGMGIPPEDQVHLFERFFRAQNVTAIQGTGLGLNIVRRYVQLMNGEITFSSEPNKGSTFTLRFKR
jgi:signal transduction histidine kinase